MGSTNVHEQPEMTASHDTLRDIFWSRAFCRRRTFRIHDDRAAGGRAAASQLTNESAENLFLKSDRPWTDDPPVARFDGRHCASRREHASSDERAFASGTREFGGNRSSSGRERSASNSLCIEIQLELTIRGFSNGSSAFDRWLRVLRHRKAGAPTA